MVQNVLIMPYVPVINNEKEAGYYHSLQSDMEFKDVERKAPNVCLACEGW